MKEFEKAKDDFRYLLDKKYDRSGALHFVGDHYRLNKLERNSLLRVVCSTEEERKRKEKRMAIGSIAGKELFIDGYNVLIGTEAVLENKDLECQDGFVRDAMGFFGRYRMGNRTIKSITRILKLLKKYEPEKVTVFFDAQIPKSGDLAKLVNLQFERYGLKGEAKTSRATDRELKESSGIVATSDTIIIESAERVLDIPHAIKTDPLGKSLIKNGRPPEGQSTLQDLKSPV